MKLILPKRFPNLDKYASDPLFFLAGPILGGGDWQKRMSIRLMELTDDCIVVNPSRYGTNHPHYRYAVDGEEARFPHQTAWEHYFLQQAAQKWHSGCLIFWLPEESIDSPRDDGQPYGRDTRGELAAWRIQKKYSPDTRLVVGIEPGFPGREQIRRNFELDLGVGFTIYNSLEEVVEVAALIAESYLAASAISREPQQALLL